MLNDNGDNEMNEGYLLYEHEDDQNPYYLACTDSGAIYYCAVNENKELVSDWKLVSVNNEAIEVVH